MPSVYDDPIGGPVGGQPGDGGSSGGGTTGSGSNDDNGQLSWNMCMPDLPTGLSENGVIDNIRDSYPFFRSNGYGWFADMIEETITSNVLRSYGDLLETYDLVKAMWNEVQDQIHCQREQKVAEYMMAIFSPDHVAIIFSFGIETAFSPAYRRIVFKALARQSQVFVKASEGFTTFNKFKAAYGNAGQGKHWHHIVEQSTADSGFFDPRLVHNPKNLVQIEGGFSGSWYTKITARYATKRFYPETGELSLREWLKTQPYEVHMEWGLRVMNELKP